MLRRSLERIVREPRLRAVLAFSLFGAAYYVAYRYAMAFSQASASPFWFPDSVLLPRIFDPFFTTRPAGMGLGLTVCRTIVNTHEGKVWAENNGNRGASFHVVLPRADAAP